MKRWTKDEEDCLRNLRATGKVTNREIAEFMNRSQEEIISKANRMGLERNKCWEHNSGPWGVEETEKLRQLYKLHTHDEIADRLGRTKNQVLSKAKRIGLGYAGAHSNRSREKLIEDAKVVEHYINHGREETLTRFGITPHRFMMMRKKIYAHEEFKHLRSNKKWTADEILYFAQRAGLIAIKILNRNLGRGKAERSSSPTAKLPIKADTFNGFNQKEASELVGRYVEGIQVYRVDGRPLRAIVPWVTLYPLYKVKENPDGNILLCLKVLADWQVMLYCAKDYKDVHDTMVAIAAEGK